MKVKTLFSIVLLATLMVALGAPTARQPVVAQEETITIGMVNFTLC
jgi:hypothetical protein